MADDAFLYERVASDVAALIRAGALRAGDRLPSVRRTSRDRGVSLATVLAAYTLLEHDGLIEVRPKSGHFVRQGARPPRGRAAPRFSRKPIGPSVASAVAALLSSMRDAGVVPFGSACVAPELLPLRALNRTLASIVREMGLTGASYDPPPGLPTLRRQLARRSLLWGLSLGEDEIVATVGASEAMHLALRAVTRPGDTIVVESPAYFGTLQLAEALSLRVLEIPLREGSGLDLDALESVLKTTSVAAAVVMPSFQNPTGARMTDDDKARLVRLGAVRGVPIIEDDVYGDLPFSGSRPRPLRAFDKAGRTVILCGSVSKTLAPGFRVGWVVGGRYQERIENLKFAHTVANPAPLHMAVAEYLASGRYDRHVRTLRARLGAQVSRFRAAIAAAFPAGTSVSHPQGGYVLWVELPGGRDALELQQRALAEDIAIAPGAIFSAHGRWRSALRINCGFPWSPRIAAAIDTLGALAHEGGSRPKELR